MYFPEPKLGTEKWIHQRVESVFLAEMKSFQRLTRAHAEQTRASVKRCRDDEIRKDCAQRRAKLRKFKGPADKCELACSSEDDHKEDGSYEEERNGNYQENTYEYRLISDLWKPRWKSKALDAKQVGG